MLRKVLILLSICVISFVFFGSKKYSVMENKKDIYLQKGKEISESAFKHLSTNLKEEIAKNSFSGAVAYCKVNAKSILDGVDKSGEIEIERVSDKNRNKGNKANKLERKIIENYKNTLKDNLKLEPVLIANKSDVIFYSPIKTMALCLNCHGDKNTQIDTKTLEVINSSYPNDKATGYKLDMIRGLWKITFKNQNENIKIVE